MFNQTTIKELEVTKDSNWKPYSRTSHSRVSANHTTNSITVFQYSSGSFENKITINPHKNSKDVINNKTPLPNNMKYRNDTYAGFIVATTPIQASESESDKKTTKEISQKEESRIPDRLGVGSSKFNMSANDVIVFLHIQKTGGSAMENFLVEDMLPAPYKCKLKYDS